MEKEIIESKSEEIKKYIGETDAESRSKVDGFIEWLKENDSPEVQECPHLNEAIYLWGSQGRTEAI